MLTEYASLFFNLLFSLKKKRRPTRPSRPNHNSDGHFYSWDVSSSVVQAVQKQKNATADVSYPPKELIEPRRSGLCEDDLWRGKAWVIVQEIMRRGAVSVAVKPFAASAIIGLPAVE
jgi:hypothetical protein